MHMFISFVKLKIKNGFQFYKTKNSFAKLEFKNRFQFYKTKKWILIFQNRKINFNFAKRKTKTEKSISILWLIAYIIYKYKYIYNYMYKYIYIYKNDLNGYTSAFINYPWKHTAKNRKRTTRQNKAKYKYIYMYRYKHIYRYKNIYRYNYKRFTDTYTDTEIKYIILWIITNIII